MARLTMSQGLCPACGRSVARSISTQQGMVTETYICPKDGRRVYAPHAMSVSEWAAPAMTELRRYPGIEGYIV